MFEDEQDDPVLVLFDGIEAWADDDFGRPPGDGRTQREVAHYLHFHSHFVSQFSRLPWNRSYAKSSHTRPVFFPLDCDAHFEFSLDFDAHFDFSRLPLCRSYAKMSRTHPFFFSSGL